MSKIDKIKKVLEEYKIELPKEVTLLDADARVYDYYGYKYADPNSCIKNANVLLQLKHKEVEKPFWITFFQGGQHKSAKELFVFASWNKPFVNEALYKQDGISKDDKEKGTEIVLDLKDQLDFLFFKSTEEQDCLFDSDPDIIYNLAYELESIVCLNININIPYKKIALKHIKELETALQEAKEAYNNNKDN